MYDELKVIVIRKLTAAFFTTTFISILLASLYFKDTQFEYNLGNQLMGWSFFYSIYVGAIILIYGSTISIALEIIKRKWFKMNDLLYVLLHGIFGLANGLFFAEWGAALPGMAAALFFALIDRWIYRRTSKQKPLKLFVLTPIVVCLATWGLFQIISPPMPPFTKEDAVASTTDGEGDITDVFPEQAGKWQGEINGYQIVRETSAEEVGDEKYIVTFTESWESNKEEGSWFLFYEVDRQSMTLYQQGGQQPDYYK
ncbi:hypothetical protein CIL03_05250 [Virgibacillus indicus]|uniref:Uncharacterized protein n=1 Tax=Virgibacillus indicus TaxID=2024554 RepID=A0A265NET5_9BACI|nr:hypothetical protein [Virgibacillus indicus]OZU90552.1 hypothetical protein CIL03_05250 [Virgibacillus indicus]